MSKSNPFTVGDLREMLKIYSDDDILSFDGGLTFGRLKTWGDNEVVLLFAEPQAHVDKDFKKKNPHFKVGFMSTEHIEWDESEIIGGPIDVSLR